VLEEFIYIIQTHLNKSSEIEGEEQREFGMKMFDLFQDIDVNGDGNLEWQEFTSFVVEKANILNKRLKSTSIAHYYDNSEALDVSALYRHRHDISKFAKIPNLCQFAMVVSILCGFLQYMYMRTHVIFHRRITEMPSMYSTAGR
jgi:hypothetical protein